MRISHLFGSAALAVAFASTSLQAATTDVQAKCEGQLAAQQGNLETGKLLGQMLGNEKLSNALNQVEGGCAQLNADGLAANAAGNDAGAVNDKVQAVSQAKDAVLGLGKMFGK
ncbi:hypothetical protein NAU58_01825 [Pseudomonas stutzeri]|uniref:Uncharacterized protein n=1 Tax=Stutzerimonas stutzeri TaxID=316 RepID=A0A2N8S3X5_STUST|nr:hypothetical protein [Stutzerimonas stutzeri]MCQ4294305.1 hypothetical protein [Stutzerimonas stutzeri]PNF81312.1 hypothetical protein CXK92_05610 [Stutzerimonas stutzeri]